MSLKQTKVAGFYEIDIPVHSDERGSFEQWFTQWQYTEELDNFQPEQANTSTSKKGVIRGIHYSLANKGQAKMVICVHGKIRDVAVDLRRSSTTFGKYDVIDLEAGSGKVSFISAGLGHAFEVLSESATIVYLLSSKYSPFFEKEINPLDSDIKIDWLSKNPILSEKDKAAQSFKDYSNMKRD
jgi:dTDP-4-dehydrorhamnose 3,5-epimerase